MSERHSDPAASGRAMSTGEFRAAPDISANTAQFQAFAQGAGETTGQWDAAVPSRSPARVILLIAAIVVVIAVIAILAATLG